jgi:outer membrane immunogenic protein
VLAIGLAGISIGARAADIYRNDGVSLKDSPVYAPVGSWSGFYFGINGGYGSANEATGLDYFASAPGAVLVNTGQGFNSDGGFFGGQIGYNWQNGFLGLGPNFVFGIEADLQGAGIGDKFQGATTGVGKPVVPAGLAVDGKQSLDYFGTVRGRVGYSFGSALVYATGGFAYGGLRSTVIVDGGAADFARDTTETGYAVGGGVEYHITPAWSFKAEYQYLDFGRQPLNGLFLGSVPTFTNAIDESFHTVRFGLNYHFNTYEPLK